MAGTKSPVELGAPFATGSEVYAAVARDGEVITDSGLAARYTWPAEDPRSRSTSVQKLDGRMLEIAREAADTSRFDLAAFQQRHRDEQLHEQILELLNHRAFQFNSRVNFRSPESPWRARIKAAVEAGRPVTVVLPVFCVISNPVKRFQQTVPTFAEDISLLHLSGIARSIAQIYPPGAVFHLVSDSTFYSTPFGVTSVEALCYIERLRGRITELDLGAFLQLHDMSNLLGAALTEFQDSFDRWCQKLAADPLSDGISEAELKQWTSSMMASINVRKLGLSYEDLRAVFGGQQSGRTSWWHEPVAERARWALTEYRAVKLAATELEWEDRFFPGAVRATIHTKRMPVLGIRLYPEYKFSSNLLPYHGIGVIGYSSKSRAHRMRIEPEMFVAARDDVTRVVDEAGTTLFYYEAPRK